MVKSALGVLGLCLALCLAGCATEQPSEDQMAAMRMVADKAMGAYANGDAPELSSYFAGPIGEEENAVKFLELMRGIYGSVESYEFQEAPQVQNIVQFGGPDGITQEFVYSMVSGSCPNDCFAKVLVGEVDSQWRVLEFNIVKRQKISARNHQSPNIRVERTSARSTATQFERWVDRALAAHPRPLSD